MNPVHPFFGKPQDQKQDAPFQWLKSLGTTGTCLHGINLQPKAASKVAALDLDGTVIQSAVNSSGKPTFEWWRSSVPDKLRELHQSGYDHLTLTHWPCLISEIISYSLLIISNQGIKAAALKVWKAKISLIGEAVSTVIGCAWFWTQSYTYKLPLAKWCTFSTIGCNRKGSIPKTDAWYVEWDRKDISGGRGADR